MQPSIRLKNTEDTVATIGVYFGVDCSLKKKKIDEIDLNVIEYSLILIYDQLIHWICCSIKISITLANGQLTESLNLKHCFPMMDKT